MTGQPAVKVGDYVVARHTNGDEIRGEVTQANGAGTHWAIRTGEIFAWLDREGWTFELAERPQPPLKDGVYQMANSLRFRRDGLWFASPYLAKSYRDDAFYRDAGWQYVGPEVSQ